MSLHSTPFKGVSFHKLTGKYQARYRGKHLGLFDTPEKARDRYEEEFNKVKEERGW